MYICMYDIAFEVFSLVVSGHALLLLAPKMYVFHWQNDGNPFFTDTRPSHLGVSGPEMACYAYIIIYI